jgi:hypothetical protein
LENTTTVTPATFRKPALPMSAATRSSYRKILYSGVNWPLAYLFGQLQRRTDRLINGQGRKKDGRQVGRYNDIYIKQLSTFSPLLNLHIFKIAVLKVSTHYQLPIFLGRQEDGQTDGQIKIDRCNLQQNNGTYLTRHGTS